jgi:hypothetical protein
MIDDPEFTVQTIGAAWVSMTGPVYMSVIMADYDAIDIMSAAGMFVRLPNGKTARVCASVMTDALSYSPEKSSSAIMHRNICVGGVMHDMTNSVHIAPMSKWQIAALLKNNPTGFICPAEIYDKIFKKGKP